MRQYFSVLFLVLLLPRVVCAWSARVVGISDGDSLTVLPEGNRQVKIRLYGIDAPEKKQPWGQRSKQSLSDLCFDKDAEVEEAGRDRYGRTVAIVSCAEENANEVQIGRGMAWIYPQYCKRVECQDWKMLEAQARAHHFGLWTDPNPIVPWEWRRIQKR